MDVGFVSAGGFGPGGVPSAIAGRLLAAGHRLHTLSGQVTTAGGVMAAGRPQCHPDGRALAAASAVVLLLLPDADDIEVALFGAAGVAAGLGPGTLLIDLSSLPPDRAATNAERIAALGAALVDAPLSGGVAAAGAGALTIDLGGDEGACARAEPLLALIASSVTRAGGPGTGQRARLIRALGPFGESRPCGKGPLVGDPDGLHHVLHLLTGPDDTVGGRHAPMARL